MMQQEMDFVNEDGMFAGTHEKGMGVAEVEDESGRADLKESRKNQEDMQSDVVVCKGVSGCEEGGNG